MTYVVKIVVSVNYASDRLLELVAVSSFEIYLAE